MTFLKEVCRTYVGSRYQYASNEYASNVSPLPIVLSANFGLIAQ